MTDEQILVKLERVVTQVEEVHRSQSGLNDKIEHSIDELYSQTRSIQTKQAALDAKCTTQHSDCNNRHSDQRNTINMSFKQFMILITVISAISVGGSILANSLGG